MGELNDDRYQQLVGTSGMPVRRSRALLSGNRRQRRAFGDSKGEGSLRSLRYQAAMP
jgi:hypothetical protein